MANQFPPKHSYRVTRTWYVEAESINDAISKSNQILHKDVRVTKLKHRYIEEGNE